ncbi:hypothetical protein VMCG_08091 [Cytospora schulzeri]|uniref:Uncharacterized protein n=1 Tax=Cytospora schulzeri TaxID=448051 RepID=A0A423VRE6_9PEZI|nr:hypothetical protein VMCG_08091 [Valsa malicola]
MIIDEDVYSTTAARKIADNGNVTAPMLLVEGSVSGTATSLIPLSTAWSSAGADCAQAIYEQIAGNFLGWDPWYVHYIDGDLTTCWPPEASSWWNQDESPATSLGTTFVCPSAYHVAYTSSVGSHTTKTICCPSGYDLYVVDFARPTFPSQCTSTLTAGETLSWEKIYYESGLGDTWTPTSTTVQSEMLTIFGIPVNGLNVIATSTSTSTTSTNAGAGTITSTGTATTASKSSSSTPTSGSSSSGGTSIVGIAVGASVGAVVGVLLIGLTAFLTEHLGRYIVAFPNEALLGRQIYDFVTLCLDHVGPDPKCSQTEQHVYQTRVYLGRTVVEVGNKAKGGVATADLEAVFQANRQSMKRASQLTSFSECIKMLSPLKGLFEEYFGEATGLKLAVSQ